MKNEAGKVKLTLSEKAAMRKLLLDFMKERPLAQSGGGFRVVSPYHSRWYVFARQAAMVGAVVLVAGVGTSFAAEGALPGDALYQIKVRVNENLKGVVSVGPVARADWQAWVIERRLTEATDLASEGRLDAKTRAELEMEIEAGAGRAHDRVSELATAGDVLNASKVSSRLEGALTVHSRVLERLAEAHSEDKEEVLPIAAKIKAEAAEIASRRFDLEAEVTPSISDDVKNVAEKKYESIAKELEDAKKNFVSRQNTSSERAGAVASSQTTGANWVASVEDRLTAGRAKLDSGKYGEAFVIFGEADRIAGKAARLSDMGKRYKLDLEDEDISDSEYDFEKAIATSTFRISSTSPARSSSGKSSGDNFSTDRRDGGSSSKEKRRGFESGQKDGKARETEMLPLPILFNATSSDLETPEVRSGD